MDHPSNTEDDITVGMSSKDEVEGLAASPRVARHSFSGSAAAPTEVPALSEPHPAEDEVVVKKRALKWVKQQVSALLHGEDLLKGFQARQVAKVPHQIPAVPREAKDYLCVSAVLQDTPLVDGAHGSAPGCKNYPCTKCGEGVGPQENVEKTHISLCPR